MVRPDECHHPANGLLPWYVKGTLQGSELEWVKDHVESCDSCSYECDALSEPPVEIVTASRAPVRARWSGRSQILAAALVVVVTLGICCFLMATADARTARLASATYLDLGIGPTRAADPLNSVPAPGDGDSLVISFFPPLSARAVYSFDLEGPRGITLVRQRPIADMDAMGRATYAFPSSFFAAKGEYAVVVRVASPDGETRLYPYPFEVGLLQRQSPASTNAPQ